MQDTGFFSNTEYSFSSFFFFLKEITCGKIVWRSYEFPLGILFISHPIPQILVTKNELQFLMLVIWWLKCLLLCDVVY